MSLEQEIKEFMKSEGVNVVGIAGPAVLTAHHRWIRNTS